MNWAQYACQARITSIHLFKLWQGKIALQAKAGKLHSRLIVLSHHLARKPVPTFRDRALLLAHDLIRKPVPTFRDRAR
jgi:hypothetical protein